MPDGSSETLVIQLAQRILDLLDEAGADGVEKSAALAVVHHIDIARRHRKIMTSDSSPDAEGS